MLCSTWYFFCLLFVKTSDFLRQNDFIVMTYWEFSFGIASKTPYIGTKFFNVFQTIFVWLTFHAFVNKRILSIIIIIILLLSYYSGCKILLLILEYSTSVNIWFIGISSLRTSSVLLNFVFFHEVLPLHFSNF